LYNRKGGKNALSGSGSKIVETTKKKMGIPERNEKGLAMPREKNSHGRTFISLRDIGWVMLGVLGGRSAGDLEKKEGEEQCRD